MVAIERANLKSTNFRGISTGRRLAPVHPGEVLLRDFIEPLGITRYKVAKLAGVQQRRIGEICAGQRAITGDTALRLARLFGTDAAFWINLQAQYDLEVPTAIARAHRSRSHATRDCCLTLFDLTTINKDRPSTRTLRDEATLRP